MKYIAKPNTREQWLARVPFDLRNGHNPTLNRSGDTSTPCLRSCLMR